MITLFVKTGCPYCAKVLRAVEVLQVPVTQKNIAEAGVMDELISLGGKSQTPFLIDDERGVQMYESKHIIKYLCEHFGGDPADFDEEVANVCPL